MRSVIVLNAVMLNAIMLNVIMLNVVAPIFTVVFPGGKQQLDLNPPYYHQ